MKKIYIIRHCKAEGQEAEATLTPEGETQSLELAHFLKDLTIDRIISSPYARSIQTIQPFAKQQEMIIETDDRLKERVLSTQLLPDWLEKLEKTFEDGSLKYDGGESSDEAAERIQAVINEILTTELETVALVTHGNLMSLLLQEYIEDFGFNDWQKLSNPDVYLLELNMDLKSCKRMWKQ